MPPPLNENQTHSELGSTTPSFKVPRRIVITKIDGKAVSNVGGLASSFGHTSDAVSDKRDISEIPP